MVELRKTRANQYDVVVDEQVMGQVWNWHGSWSAQADGKTRHGLMIPKRPSPRVRTFTGRVDSTVFVSASPPKLMEAPPKDAFFARV